MSIDMTVKMGPKCFQGIHSLDLGQPIDEKQILDICEYINLRLDCADFRMVSVLRTLYAYQKLLSKETIEIIKKTILNFKYWMDEPGDDSMCYWSENHQLLFASVEYLAGQLYPDLVFKNASLTGAQHLGKAKAKLLRWLEYRFDYGFIEWHSNTYYEEDIAPLSILIDFCRDQEIVIKAKMIMDLLLLDMAMHSWKGLFSATSGRCYEKQKKRPLAQDTLEISEYVWEHGNIQAFDYSRISSNFLLMKNYAAPEVIQLIGRDTNDVEIRDSMGLDLSEIKREFKDPDDIDTTGMFLWAMESFTNPESIDMAMKVFNEWKLYKNNFLKDLKMINKRILRELGLLPLLVKLLNPVTQGVAIQRANSYTYKTGDFMLSTALNYHPGEFGDQQHIWQATLSNEVTVFTTHPGCPFFDDNDRNFSPGYWVGNGILPHSAQFKNVHMSIYNLTKRKGFMERERLKFTHAWFPQDKFHEVVWDNNYLFGRLYGVYLALIGRNSLRANPTDPNDIIQEGAVTWWICEIGSRKIFDSFEDFCHTIKKKSIAFKNGVLEYNGTHQLTLAYKKCFKVDGKTIDTHYKRYATPYVNAERKPKELTIRYKDKSLYLNFGQMVRRTGDATS